MKILSLNYEYPPLGGGAGALSEDLNRQLAAAGHRVCVVTMHYPGLPKQETKDGVEIFRIPCLRKHRASCAPWEQLSYLISLRRFMRTHPELQRFDVCHSHFIVPTGLGALKIRSRYGMPYILTAHGSDVEGHNDKLSVRLIHRLIRGMWRRIVDGSYRTVSPSVMLKELMARNYPSDRYRIIPNGIDIAAYAADMQEEIVPRNDDREKRPMLLLLGRMQESKNFQTVLKALNLVRPDGWHIELVGDGPYRKTLEAQAERLGLGSIVTFRGWVDHGSAEHTELIRNAALFVSASRCENCPVAVLEAAAAGSTLILSDIPGHRSMMGDQALYFPADDVGELAKILRSELGKERRRKHYDIRAFSWEAVVPLYEKLLTECAAAAGRSRG